MLSGETSTGLHPVECVEVLNRVATRIERSGGFGYAKDAILEDNRQKTVAAAVVLANSLTHSKLIVFTRHGTMARSTSNLRPEHSTVFAFTPSEEVRRQLSICWGVSPMLIEFSDDPNETVEMAAKYLREQKLTAPGDNLVVISDVQARGERIDCVLLWTVK
jgi:pyruvate kinase